ncbi:Gldg family protein [Fluviispira vulneris]|uniref:Gldg family protein n=1 Tax=Fluviispira vulneris TaxID=2763012 RepID=UPI001649596F|nr:Gldg family protein [Fluviispira vulneris]
MKKHKLEFSIATIFLIFVTLLMWENLVLINKYFPIGLVLLGAIVLAYLVSPLGNNKNKENTAEKYAPKYFAQAIISSLIGMCLIIGLAVVLNKNNFSKSFDLTSNKINSLTPESVKILSTLTKPVEIICVPSSNLGENYCDSNIDLLSLYMKTSPQIINVGQLSLTDKAMVQKIQPSGFSRLVLMSGNNKSEIDGVITESKLTNAIINLVKFKKVVYFLSGSGEPSVNPDNSGRSYSDVVSVLQAKSYEVKEWNIKQGNLPQEAKVLIAGDNNLLYGEEVQNILRNFIGFGGRLILLVNPYREQGLERLYTELNLKLDPILLTLNTSTPIGQQLVKQNFSRPPILASNFNPDSPITKVFADVYGAQAIMPLDGGRPISILANENPTGKVLINATNLLSAYSAAPITIAPEVRNKIDLMAPFRLSPDANFDANKIWTIGVNLDISGASNLAVEKVLNKETDPAKDKAQVVVFGFSILGPYARDNPISENLLPITVAHLYQDQELVSIPPRDFTPKQFNMSLYPGRWLPFFAGILPVITAISGLFIWFKRRSA